MRDERDGSRVLAALFNDARTFSHWQARPVSEALVEAAFDLACLGPTSGNCQPWRLVLVRSPAAKERLLTLRLVGQLREGADRADHRDCRL